MSVQIKEIFISVAGNHLVSIPEWDLKNGKVYGMYGDTGSGKSTIGKWLAGVEPQYWRVKGNPEWDNGFKSLFDKEQVQSKSNNSSVPLYLLQDAYLIFNPYITILTHFKDIWNHFSSQSKLESFDEIFDILLEIGIHNPRAILLRKIHQVSQGEAQRMAFVLGFIRPASIRIYDEVFSNVDEEASEAMLTYLNRYCTRTNSSAIIISHETNYFGGLMDETFQIRDGILEKTQTIPDNFSSPQIKRNYPPFIELGNVELPSYSSDKRGKKILWSLQEFSICRSENVGIFGNSGVGKTTFLRSLLGEHPLNCIDCRIWDKDSSHSFTDMNSLDIRYLPQSVVSAFNPAYTIQTSLRELQDTYKVDNDRLKSLLDRFGLKNVNLEKFPNELSGGEIQRLGIISVLLGNPDLILLDESFSSVDKATRDSIWNVLMNEKNEMSFSLLVVSHDSNWLKTTMNRIYEMQSP